MREREGEVESGRGTRGRELTLCVTGRSMATLTGRTPRSVNLLPRMMPAFSKLPEEKIVDHTWLEGNRLVVIQEAQVHIISAEELQVVRTIETLCSKALYSRTEAEPKLINNETPLRESLPIAHIESFRPP